MRCQGETNGPMGRSSAPVTWEVACAHKAVVPATHLMLHPYATKTGFCTAYIDLHSTLVSCSTAAAGALGPTTQYSHRGRVTLVTHDPH